MFLKNVNLSIVWKLVYIFVVFLLNLLVVFSRKSYFCSCINFNFISLQWARTSREGLRAQDVLVYCHQINFEKIWKKKRKLVLGLFINYFLIPPFRVELISWLSNQSEGVSVKMFDLSEWWLTTNFLNDYIYCICKETRVVSSTKYTVHDK